MKQAIKNEFSSHLETINTVINTMEEKLEAASALAVETLRNGNKILLCGNGGSAADAQHIAAELTGRYKSERRGESTQLWLFIAILMSNSKIFLLLIKHCFFTYLSE